MGWEENTISLLEKLRQHNDWSYVHSLRVRDYAVEIGIFMELSRAEMEILSATALLHDIGKLMVPVVILDKPGSLTQIEFQQIKEHIWAGYRILSERGYPAVICEAVRDHHERYDGKGYGGRTAISLPAKILCLADAYDAMKHSRPYRKAMTEWEVYQEIAVNSGKQFDPEVCKAALCSLFTGAKKKNKKDGRQDGIW